MDNVALIFDMDGLLVDSEILWEQAERAMLAERGVAHRDEVRRRHIGMRLDESCAVMVREYGLDDAPEVFGREWVDRLLVAFERSLQPMPGAVRLMDEALARGLPVAIASSSPMRVVRFVTERFGWGERLAAICAGDEPEVARGKPAPDIFLLAAKRLRLPPERCVVLEDSVNGARAAQAAGMRCIAVPSDAYHPRDFEGLAARVAPSLEALSLDELIHPLVSTAP